MQVGHFLVCLVLVLELTEESIGDADDRAESCSLGLELHSFNNGHISEERCCISVVCLAGHEPELCSREGGQATCNPCKDGEYQKNSHSSSLMVSCERPPYKICPSLEKTIWTEGTHLKELTCVCNWMDGKVSATANMTDPEGRCKKSNCTGGSALCRMKGGPGQEDTITCKPRVEHFPFGYCSSDPPMTPVRVPSNGQTRPTVTDASPGYVRSSVASTTVPSHTSSVPESSSPPSSSSSRGHEVTKTPTVPLGMTNSTSIIIGSIVPVILFVALVIVLLLICVIRRQTTSKADVVWKRKKKSCMEDCVHSVPLASSSLVQDGACSMGDCCVQSGSLASSSLMRDGAHSSSDSSRNSSEWGAEAGDSSEGNGPDDFVVVVEGTQATENALDGYLHLEGCTFVSVFTGGANMST